MFKESHLLLLFSFQSCQCNSNSKVTWKESEGCLDKKLADSEGNLEALIVKVEA